MRTYVVLHWQHKTKNGGTRRGQLPMACRDQSAWKGMDGRKEGRSSGGGGASRSGHGERVRGAFASGVKKEFPCKLKFQFQYKQNKTKKTGGEMVLF